MGGNKTGEVDALCVLDECSCVYNLVGYFFIKSELGIFNNVDFEWEKNVDTNIIHPGFVSQFGSKLKLFKN